MKRAVILLFSVFSLAVLMLVVALKVPIPLAVDSDFQVLYYTTQGLTRGVDVYDHAAKMRMIAQVYGVDVDEGFIPQFAYPPWYALTTVYLGLFPIKSAAVLWFEINLVLLFLSVWFLTDGWRPLYRLLAFPAALFFYPVLGMLAVGQYDFPVLLGVSMLAYALPRQRPGLTALGMSLLTFKPHLGGLILLAGLVYLASRRDGFGRQALLNTMFAGGFLLLAGFLADSRWPLSYFDSLFRYRELGHITTCADCVNLSVWLSRRLSGVLSLSQAGAIAGAVLSGLLVILFFNRRALFASPPLLLASALLTTILASPYLYNYDYALLLVPFALLAGSKLERAIVGACILGPTLALALYGRAGNTALILAALATAALLYARLRSQVDFPVRTSYNTTNRI